MSSSQARSRDPVAISPVGALPVFFLRLICKPGATVIIFLCHLPLQRVNICESPADKGCVFRFALRIPLCHCLGVLLRRLSVSLPEHYAFDDQDDYQHRLQHSAQKELGQLSAPAWHPTDTPLGDPATEVSQASVVAVHAGAGRRWVRTVPVQK